MKDNKYSNKSTKLLDIDKEKLSKTTEMNSKVLVHERVLFDDLVLNPNNFYALTDIESLADSILTNGLNSPLTVRQLNDETYEIVCGHRRYKAIEYLLDERKIKNRYVDVVVVKVTDDDAMLRLIEDNSLTRELSDYEKLQEVQHLKEIYTRKKKQGNKIPGRVLDLISEDKNVARSKLVRYDAINRRLIKELYEKIKDKQLNLSCAYEICTLDNDIQYKILKLFENDPNGSGVTMSQIIDLKNKLVSEANKEEIVDEFVIKSSSASENEKIDKRLSTIRRVSTTVTRNADSVRRHLIRFKKMQRELDDDTKKQLEATLEVINGLKSIIEEYFD